LNDLTEMTALACWVQNYTHRRSGRSIHLADTRTSIGQYHGWHVPGVQKKSGKWNLCAFVRVLEQVLGSQARFCLVCGLGTFVVSGKDANGLRSAYCEVLHLSPIYLLSDGV
jgi:hypothetical protein